MVKMPLNTIMPSRNRFGNTASALSQLLLSHSCCPWSSVATAGHSVMAEQIQANPIHQTGLPLIAESITFAKTRTEPGS